MHKQLQRAYQNLKAQIGDYIYQLKLPVYVVMEDGTETNMQELSTQVEVQLIKCTEGNTVKCEGQAE